MCMGDGIASTVIGGASAFFVGIQICINIQLNRNNKTFEMISQLDDIMNEKDKSRREIAKQTKLLDDSARAITVCRARKVLKNSHQAKGICEILNFYETLAVAVLSKNINEQMLQSMSGYRILNAYRKLHPFIVAIRIRNFKGRQSMPYQHFETLYYRWVKLKKFKHYGGKI